MYVDFTKDIIYFGQINCDKGFTLSAMIRDMPERELSKIRYLGMSQELWNYKPFCNGHVLMDFRSLKSLTLAMERQNVTKHKNVMFVKPKEADFTVSAFYDPDMDDSDTGIFWRRLWRPLFLPILARFGSMQLVSTLNTMSRDS